jgi:hypothetical protein
MAQYQEGQIFEAPGQPPLVYRGGRFVAAQSAPSAIPQTIQGPPKVVDPAEAERLRLAREADARSAATSAREAAKFNQDQQARVAGGGVEATADQRKAAGFYQRALKADKLFGDMNFQPRNAGSQMLADTLPKDVVNTATSPARQTAETYMRDFIMSTLRQESGAAISAGEIENQKRTFFPQPGDSPEAIKAKQMLRQHEIDSLQSQDMAPEAPEQGPRLSPEQEADLKAFLVTKPTPAQIQGRYASYGVGNIDEQQAQRAAEYYSKGGNQFGGVDYSKVDAAAQADARALKETRDKFQGKAGASDLIDKGALWSGSDEIGGVGNAIFEAITGDFHLSHNYKVGRDAERMRQKEAEDSYGAGAIPLEILGGFASGRPGMGGTPPAVMPSLTERLAQGARAGAKGGAIYGFNSGEGLEDSLVKGALGAGTGAAVGSAFNASAPVVGNALARFGNRPAAVARRAAEQDIRANAQPTIQAANDENVPISLPFVDPRVRNRATYLETTRAGNPVVRNALSQTSDAMEARVGEVSSGNAQDAFGAGDIVQNAGHRFIQRSRAIANRMYDRARTLAGGAQVNPQAALQVLDGHLAELNGAAESNAPLIGYLQGLRRDLAQGGLSIDTLRNIRSQMRGQINSRNLTATDAERRVGEVLEAASGDIQQALQNNPQALAAYNRADHFYRQKQDYIKDVVQRFIGKRDAQMSPEQAFSRLKQMANARGGDSARMERMMRSLEPGEAADVAATFAVDLGRDRAGNFSPNLLASQIEQLSPRARVTLFGPDGARSLNNLQMLSREFRAVSGNLNNSRTGVANNYRSWWGRAMGLIGGGGGMASGGPAGAAVGAMALNKVGGAVENMFDARAARLLMSPDFTNWLRAAPATINPNAINAHIAQLDKVAARAPQFAADIQAFQQRLSEAIKGLPAAASTPDAKQDIKNRR